MNKDKKNKLNAFLNGSFFAVLAVIAIYTILYFLGIGCPIKYFTGISCPGCGMTRAYLALLHLDIARAFYYHPLFPLVPFLFYLIFCKRCVTKNKKFLLGVIIFLFLAVYFVRMFFIKNDVVTVNFPEWLKVIYHFS